MLKLCSDKPYNPALTVIIADPEKLKERYPDEHKKPTVRSEAFMRHLNNFNKRFSKNGVRRK